MSRPRLIGSVAASLLLLAAACSSADESVGNLAPTVTPATEIVGTVAPTPVVPTATAVVAATATATATPTTEPTAAATPSGPSQSPEDAARDGVAPEIAALPLHERARITAEVEVQGQRWAVAKFPDETSRWLTESGLASPQLDPIGGELLHIEDDRVVRAISMNGLPPYNIWTDGTYVIGARQADGGYPYFGFVRVEVASGATEKFMVPQPYSRRAETLYPGWPAAAPSEHEQMYEALQAGDDATTMELLNGIFDDLDVVDLEAFPSINVRCPQSTAVTAGRTPGLALQVGDVCAVSLLDDDDPSSEPVVAVQSPVIDGDVVEVPGTLLGLGRVAGVDATLMATLPRLAQGSDERPLTLHRLSVLPNGDIEVETTTSPVLGSGPAHSIGKVSFFDGGMVLTQYSDQTVYFEAVTLDGDALPGFAMPTDVDRGYPPDPWHDHATVSQDGSRLAWIERPLAATGTPRLVLPEGEVVVANTATGVELSRTPVSPILNFRTWLDFDGRWALVSQGRDGANEAIFDSLLIDTEQGESFSQIFVVASTLAR